MFYFSCSFPRETSQKPLDKKHKKPWIKGIQNCLNEGQCPFPEGGDNRQIVKIHGQILIISS